MVKHMRPQRGCLLPAAVCKVSLYGTDLQIQVRGDLQRMLQLSNSSTAESDNVASLIAKVSK